MYWVGCADAQSAAHVSDDHVMMFRIGFALSSRRFSSRAKDVLIELQVKDIVQRVHVYVCTVEFVEEI